MTELHSILSCEILSYIGFLKVIANVSSMSLTSCSISYISNDNHICSLQFTIKFSRAEAMKLKEQLKEWKAEKDRKKRAAKLKQKPVFKVTRLDLDKLKLFSQVLNCIFCHRPTNYSS